MEPTWTQHPMLEFDHIFIKVNSKGLCYSLMPRPHLEKSLNGVWALGL